MVQALVDGIRVRDEPGLDAPQIARLSAGQRVRVAGGPEDADGYRWYQVSLFPTGTSGWVAAGEGQSPWIAAVLNGMLTWASGRDIGTIDQDGNRGTFAQRDEGWIVEWLAWAPDGLALAISEDRQEMGLQDSCVIEGRIAILDDTGRVTVRTSPPSGSYDTRPMWSPDGSQVAFTRVSQTCATPNQPGRHLYVMPATGGSERLVVSDVEGPIWSPSGEGFAFFRWDSFNSWGIWMVAADGSGERRFGSSLAGYPPVAWAPDGSVLAYARSVGDDPATTEFDVIDTAGKTRPLASYAGFIGPNEITWLPDGSGLVYYEQEAVGFTVSVSVLLLPSTTVVRFEQPDGVPDRVIVSPDGSKLGWVIQGAPKLRIQPTAGGDAVTYEEIRGSIAWQPLLIPYTP
jgi:hypothetical protein